MNKPFSITSLCREDLTNQEIGYSRKNALKITDDQMKNIASKMADDYCQQLFWESLDIILDLELKDKGKRK